MEEIMNPAETVQVVDIQFRPGQKIYFFDPAGTPCASGDHVIIDTARGEEFGTCASGVHAIPVKDVVAPLRKVIRKATPQDERVIVENRAKENRAFDACMQKIALHELDMQLVSAEYAFDGSKILFYFTADERVDFRELVKDLAGVFHTRIELRQIGVRDKAKMVGGLGICGRPFCCASFLDDFQPVSIKMAKTQNLSLNPTKISGTCGRLMCCLKYEQDTYEDLIRSSPKMDSFVDTADGRGTIVEVDILRQRVKVRMEENPDTISAYPNTDVVVLRSGKAKKNDAPVPADLAPLSGSGRPSKKQVKTEEESAPLLEPIRFRYSTEAVVEEQSAPEAAPEETVPHKSGRSRRRRGSSDSPKPEAAPENAAPKQEQKNRKKPRPEAQKEPEAPKDAPAQEGSKDGAKKPHRRPNYRRSRKPKPQNKES